MCQNIFVNCFFNNPKLCLFKLSSLCETLICLHFSGLVVGRMEGAMSNTRVIITVVIIVGCFTMLYPKLFHPIVMKMLGHAPEKPKQPANPSEYVSVALWESGNRNH